MTSSVFDFALHASALPVGHTPVSKAGYAGKRVVCEFFLGIEAGSTEVLPNEPVLENSVANTTRQETAVDTKRRKKFHGLVPTRRFAKLRVPTADLVLTDSNGFRPCDIARCAGFERIGAWLLSLAELTDTSATTDPNDETELP